MSTIRVEGLREIGEAMRLLSGDMATRVAGQATGAGAQVIKKRAIRKAPESEEPHKLEGVVVNPGNLKKNIVAKKVSKKDLGDLTAAHIVTVRGKRKDGYAARYGRLQEFGTVHHPAHPFLRPAFDEGKTEAVEAIVKRLRKRVQKAG